MLLSLLLSCASGLTCREATLDLGQLAADPAAFDAKGVVVCGELLWIEAPQLDCEPQGGDDPQLQGGYAVWTGASFGVAQGAVALAIVPVASNGVTVLSTRPDLSPGEELVVAGTVRYAEQAEPCDLDRLHPSAWLELAAADVGLDDPRDPGDPPDDTLAPGPAP